MTELEQLIEEQVKIQKQGNYQPPEMINGQRVTSLDSMLQWGTIDDLVIRHLTPRDGGGCLLHGLKYWKCVSKRTGRYQCAECNRKRSRESARRKRAERRGETSRVAERKIEQPLTGLGEGTRSLPSTHRKEHSEY